MSDKRTFILRTDAIRERCLQFIRDTGGLLQVTVKEYTPTRTLEQNAAMWALLTDIAEQVEWYGEFYSKEDWKAIITAFVRKQRVAPGIDGGVVVLGSSTSKMDVAEMSEVIEAAKWFAAEKGVRLAA